MITTPVYKPVIPGWLPAFPSHWKVMRIKNLFREIDDRSVSGSEELLSVSQYTGITPKRDSLENEDDNLTNAASLEGYKKVTAGDLVINIMLAWNGSLGISLYNGIVSPAYCVYRCLHGNNPEYFGYLFSTNLFKSEFRRNSTGIIDSRLRLYSDKFFGIFSVVPPIDEQDAIVKFIKTQEVKINRFIQKKLYFIGLLKEQRLSIITKAVSKGIDNGAKMKPSGVEWLGNVPEHWLVGRAKNVSKIFVPERNKPELNTESNGLPWITSEFLKNDSLDIKNIKQYVSDESMNESNIRFLTEGSVVASCVGSFNSAIVVPFDCIINQQLQAYVPFNIDPVFLQYVILSSEIFFQLNATQTTLKYVDKSKFGCLPIAFPQSTEEQQEVISYIKTETSIIDTAISKAEKEIELIKEYKEAMIAEVVMGKENKL